MNVFEIPSTVTTISARAFYDCSSLYRIVLPSGLTNIGDDAFGNCYRLVEVVNKSALPIVVSSSSDYGGVGFYAIQIRTTNINGIQYDGSSVYYMDPNTYRDILIDCRAKDAVIPSIVDEILSFAFVNRNVETVDLNNVNKINYRSFDNNHALYQVTTGENLTTIAENSFYNCDALSEIINKTSFDDNTLKEKCSSTGTLIRGVIKNKSDSKIKIYSDSITYNNGTDIIMVASKRYALDIKIADEVTQMSANIFKGNKNITSVRFGNNIKTIPNNAFQGCEALKEVILSDSVETIGENAFQGCYNLEKVKFGSGIKNIYSGAFKSNAALKEVKIESEVATYSSAFESCINLVNVYLPNGTVGSSVFRYCSNLKKIVVKDGTQSVASYAFNGCSHLSDVSFSVMKTLSISAFDGCESLKSINLSQATNLPEYTFRYCKKLVISDGVINNAITTIGDSAFAYCESIDKVFIEDGGNLKTIEANAFLCCYALKDLTIGNKVETIGNLAFSTCTSLETITLPKSLKTIGNRVFRSCENLKEIIFNGTTYEWDAVSKGSEWLTGTQVTQIKCSNGNIDLA